MSVMFFPEYMFHFKNWFSEFLKISNTDDDTQIYKYFQEMPKPETRQQAEHVLDFMFNYLKSHLNTIGRKCQLDKGFTNPQDIAGLTVIHLTMYAKDKSARLLALDSVVRTRKELQDFIDKLTFNEEINEENEGKVIVCDNDGNVTKKESSHKKIIDQAYATNLLIKNSFDIIHRANKFRKDAEKEPTPSQFISYLMSRPDVRETAIQQKKAQMKLSDKLKSSCASSTSDDGSNVV